MPFHFSTGFPVRKAFHTQDQNPLCTDFSALSLSRTTLTLQATISPRLSVASHLHGLHDGGDQPQRYETYPTVETGRPMAPIQRTPPNTPLSLQGDGLSRQGFPLIQC